MAAALVVALAAGAELVGWKFSGRVRAVAVAAWLTAGVVVGVITTDVASWFLTVAVLALAAWAIVRWTVGADVAVLALAAATAGLVLASDGSNRAAAIVAGAGVGVFLTHPANEVCRTVLGRVRVVPAEQSGHGLRGGRVIGPLERWIMTGLALVGAQAVVVGLMAAKGIGRFPEISGDRADGSKAEEFLVGSLVSWAIAGAGAALIASV